MIDLNAKVSLPEGVRLTDAVMIDDSGHILAIGIRLEPNGADRFRPEAYLLRTAPRIEPLAVCVLGFAATAAGAAARGAGRFARRRRGKGGSPA